MNALLYAIRAGVDDCYALPRELHKVLLADHPLAGVARTQKCVIGFRSMLNPQRVPYYAWRWNADARQRIGELRTKQDSTPWERYHAIWGLHAELMNIRPFELYNGRVGRLLMVNHAILVGEVPWIVFADDRTDYLATIHAHWSADWVNEPLYRESAVRYREW